MLGIVEVDRSTLRSFGLPRGVLRGNGVDNSGFDKRVNFSNRMVLADDPPERKPERGYIRMFPRNENRNEGTFACSPGMKTGTRAHSPKPPFYETALLSPGE